MRKRLLLLVGMVGLLLGVMVLPAFASGAPSGKGVAPQQVAGNPDCAAVGSSGVEFRHEPVEAGLHTLDVAPGVTIALSVNNNRTLFGFSITGGVIADVIVKGGPNANWYSYEDTIGVVQDDTGLHAPVRVGTNYFSLSHISFCYTAAVPNQPPVANDDFATVARGGTVSVLDSTATSVKDNDTDAEDGIPGGDVSLELGPSNASDFTLNPDGTFSYTHDGSETLSDSFTYTVKDSVGADSNVATVTIDVYPTLCEEVTIEGNGVEATYLLLDEEDCDDKTYVAFTTLTDPETGQPTDSEEDGLPTVVFEPSCPSLDPCPTGAYSFSFKDRPRASDPNEPGSPDPGTLEIDPDGLEGELPFAPATQCASYEIEWIDKDGEPFAIVTVTEADLNGATWCWAAVVTKTLTIDEEPFTQSTWFGAGREDPAKRVS